jgi:hypothetical protein
VGVTSILASRCSFLSISLPIRASIIPLPPPFWPFTNISGTSLTPFWQGFSYTHYGVLFGTHGFGFLFGNLGFGQTYRLNFTGIGITVNFGSGSIGFSVNGFSFGIGTGNWF